MDIYTSISNLTINFVSNFTINFVSEIASKSIDIVSKTSDIFMNKMMMISLLDFRTFHVVRDISLIEALVITDGFITALKFAMEYTYYKIQDNVFLKSVEYSTQNAVLKKRLIRNYNSLYSIDVIDRYTIYGIVYGIYLLLNTDSNITYGILLMTTIPMMQSWVLDKTGLVDMYSRYKRNKYVFMRYSVSKFIVTFIQRLDGDVLHIQNYHIFILYKYLTFELVSSFIKSYVFIYVLYFLRDCESTYYYYKAIKLAYYYSTGYLFNVVSKEDAVYIINVVIKEKRWFDVSKLEIVHAFYKTISDKYSSKSELSLNAELYFIKFCTLWSSVCLLKMFSVYVITTMLIVYLVSVEVINPHVSRIKRCITGVIMYMMILLHTNDLIISTVFVLHPILYYIVEELIFFTLNLQDIVKILHFYDKSDKNIFKTKTKRINKDEYIVVTKTN
jgi:hypothetical protein